MASRAVAAVIDQLAAELARSVVVNDPAMQMLYASAHYGDEDPVRVRALLNHGAGPRARGHVLAQGVSSWTRAGVIPPNPEIGMHARVCVPVRWKGELLGLLMVMDASGTLTISELNRVNEIAADLALALQDDRGPALPADDDTHLVLDLTGADPSARRDAVAALHATGRGRQFAPLTAVDVAVTGGAAPHVQVALRAALAGWGRSSELVAVDDGRAVLLIGGPDPVIRRVEAVLERVRELAAGRFRCVAGIGGAGDGPGHAARSLRQARLARPGWPGTPPSWASAARSPPGTPSGPTVRCSRSRPPS
ncbi:GAF domain-containing protein [Cryptosporangium japonicum]|uniref:GAF domain-containing protein n=1 Tax=Cryptosporangium japonicum TaxID=80872 RepID=UPI0031D04AEE